MPNVSKLWFKCVRFYYNYHSNLCSSVMMTLGFSRSFSCSFQFLSFSFTDFLRLVLPWSSAFSHDFILYLLIILCLSLLCRASFWYFCRGIFFRLTPGTTAFFPSLVSLRLVRRSARVGLTGFRFYHYGSRSFFLSTYWR